MKCWQCQNIFPIFLITHAAVAENHILSATYHLSYFCAYNYVTNLVLIITFYFKRQGANSSQGKRLSYVEFFETYFVLLFFGIRGDKLSPESLNDLFVEKCKDQIFLLNIFGKSNKGRDFKHMLLFKVIYYFFSWVNPICSLYIIFCTSFQSGDGLNKSGI